MAGRKESGGRDEGMEGRRRSLLASTVHCTEEERRRRYLTGSIDPQGVQRIRIWSCLNNFVIQKLPTFHLSS